MDPDKILIILMPVLTLLIGLSLYVIDLLLVFCAGLDRFFLFYFILFFASKQLFYYLRIIWESDNSIRAAYESRTKSVTPLYCNV